MKVVDPQTATLTNIEVLSYLTSNPPRKSPEGPPNFRNYEPKPDLRLHCSVVAEIHNYVDRISPHLLNYPRYTHDSKDSSTNNDQQESTDQQQQQQQPYIQPTEPTPLDNALRKLIRELAPYNLTKGEVMMLINLGVGTKNVAKEDTMEVDGAEAEEEEDPYYSDKAVMSSFIEDMSERLSDDDVINILTILNENLASQ
ncbi:hypothetical protein UA08_01550 [Talaromyces atroroseus]|uniref:DNA-directed RNA polymerase III subunit RPC9 n=1 Tax=Talaromyces atroroseus TaxID=1441469 RepID=A0A1Q5QC33_TALAT|nr:hypothetical protein UA08_01550 [Talaromyces atroroseus]OKL63493.1 hypothetical protein UA08_01550 [Talaromyces atroroseus]